MTLCILLSFLRRKKRVFVGKGLLQNSLLSLFLRMAGPCHRTVCAVAPAGTLPFFLIFDKFSGDECDNQNECRSDENRADVLGNPCKHDSLLSNRFLCGCYLIFTSVFSVVASLYGRTSI